MREHKKPQDFNRNTGAKTKLKTSGTPLVKSTPDTYQGPRVLMKTLFKLQTVTDPPPNIENCVSKAEVKHVFSEVKRLKTDLRN